MNSDVTIFEKNYEGYLEQLREISFDSISNLLGGKVKDGIMEMSLFGESFFISHNGIADTSGQKPSYDTCVILSKYVLLCPDVAPTESEWVSFREFKDSGPLITYFSNDVERAIASHFKENIEKLRDAGKAVSGYLPDLDVNYDIAFQFDALPKIPVVLLFNDEDEEFSVKSSVLFERRTEKYLDAECIAMLGWQLYNRLKAVQKQN
jgi:Domain of unknown function (DUF3786)